VWQLAHCAVTGTWVWLNLLGFQAVTPWQLMQLVAPVGMCVAFLPLALLPLWQLLQTVAAVKVLWSTLAPVQVVVPLWQVSHVVWPACVALLGFSVPWQVAHCVITVVLWCSLAGVQELNPALWQVSQLALAIDATS
jgi:hypothetical protein